MVVQLVLVVKPAMAPGYAVLVETELLVVTVPNVWPGGNDPGGVATFTYEMELVLLPDTLMKSPGPGARPVL